MNKVSEYKPVAIRLDKPVKNRYKFPAAILSTESDGNLILDADFVHAGDYIICPKHSDDILYVFGSGWWNSLPMVHPENWASNRILTVSCWDFKMVPVRSKIYNITCFSYAG